MSDSHIGAPVWRGLSSLQSRESSRLFLHNGAARPAAQVRYLLEAASWLFDHADSIANLPGFPVVVSDQECVGASKSRHIARSLPGNVMERFAVRIQAS